MIKFMKNNKTFCILILLTTIFLIAGILFPAILDEKTKNEITQNIINTQNQIKETSNSIPKILFANTIIIGIIWTLGISIIGIPINIILYLIKVIILGMEISLLTINKIPHKIPFSIFYVIPNIIQIFLLFIVLYYSCNYSIYLTKNIFFKKNYPIQKITKRYLKVFIVVILVAIINTILEGILIPKILKAIL